MKKRILALALAAALSLGLLAGCGDTNGGDTATPTPAADNTDTPSTQAPDDGGGSAGGGNGLVQRKSPFYNFAPHYIK